MDEIRYYYFMDKSKEVIHAFEDEWDERNQGLVYLGTSALKPAIVSPAMLRSAGYSSKDSSRFTLEIHKLVQETANDNPSPAPE